MRVVIAEDDALLRQGLVLLLETEGFDVVAAVGDAEEFLAVVAEDRPDVAVLDVRMPPGFRHEGLRAAVAARRRHPGLPVLVLSSHVEDSYASELLADRGGAVGYLLKDRVGNVAEFLEALRRVARGGTAMDPEVVAQLMVRRRTDDPLNALTGREREVLALMAEGHDNAAIARLCAITGQAVSKHIGSIFTKLDLTPAATGHRRVLAVLAHLRG
ncbi:response regulator [Streptomyces sp. NPDC007983]|uniref:response regulator transcription factor n=1 Tax=Streptomyces sp. NPDC007983 TaxID=3364800 RepID=UPI0036EC4C75